MTTPNITLLIAGLCGLLQFALTIYVIARRAQTGVSFLDGGDELLLRRIRAHGNFTETALGQAKLQAGFVNSDVNAPSSDYEAWPAAIAQSFHWRSCGLRGLKGSAHPPQSPRSYRVAQQ